MKQENNENLRTIKLHAQEVKKEKQQFITCSTEIKGIWYKVKFTKDCEKLPKKKGLYDLTINLNNCSIEKGKTYTNNDGVKLKNNDIIWVREVVALRMFSEDELQEMNLATLRGIFDNE